MNLRPAPFMLNEATVAAIIAGTAGPGVALVPVVSMRLVDRPRRSENPRLARANDNGDAL